MCCDWIFYFIAPFCILEGLLGILKTLSESFMVTPDQSIQSEIYVQLPAPSATVGVEATGPGTGPDAGGDDTEPPSSCDPAFSSLTSKGVEPSAGCSGNEPERRGS